MNNDFHSPDAEEHRELSENINRLLLKSAILSSILPLILLFVSACFLAAVHTLYINILTLIFLAMSVSPFILDYFVKLKKTENTDYELAYGKVLRFKRNTYRRPSFTAFVLIDGREEEVRVFGLNRFRISENNDCVIIRYGSLFGLNILKDDLFST